MDFQEVASPRWTTVCHAYMCRLLAHRAIALQAVHDLEASEELAGLVADILAVHASQFERTGSLAACVWHLTLGCAAWPPIPAPSETKWKTETILGNRVYDVE